MQLCSNFVATLSQLCCGDHQQCTLSKVGMSSLKANYSNSVSCGTPRSANESTPTRKFVDLTSKMAISALGKRAVVRRAQHAANLTSPSSTSSSSSSSFSSFSFSYFPTPSVPPKGDFQDKDIEDQFTELLLFV